MQATELQNKIMRYIRAKSGFETQRAYLGMSHLGDCPRRQYDDFRNGLAVDDERHRMAFLGYAYESLEIGILTGAGILRSVRRELVADFDERLRGHIDGETVDGDLVEIKSVSRYKFDLVELEMRATPEHFAQVQSYMHFGGYLHCEVVYVCREDFRHCVVHVPYSVNAAARLVEKAKRVLVAIDAQTPPACECKRCGHVR